MFDLKGKKALITGASGGIGKEIATTLDSFGAEICISGRNSEELNSLNNKVKQECKIITCDLTKDNDITNLVKGAEEELGQIDILVNNAGITKDNIFLRMSDEEWDQVLKVNLYSTFKILKLATKGMVKRKYGRIINITSVIGQIGNAGQSNYAASKAGIMGLTKSMAKELGSRNITVNSVSPGYIITDMTDKINDNIKITIQSSIPLGRLGTPDDVANLVCFLASEEAGYITGQTFNVDGGMVMI